MFAALAALCFFIALFTRSVFDGGLDLVIAGLCLLALHLVVPVGLPGRRQP